MTLHDINLLVEKLVFYPGFSLNLSLTTAHYMKEDSRVKKKKKIIQNQKSSMVNICVEFDRIL